MKDWAEKESRRRVTFDADEDVWSVLQTMPRGQRKEYLNDVVRRERNPFYRFFIPHMGSDPRTVDSLGEHLANAKRSIVLVDSNLSEICDVYSDELRRKAESSITMTFITIYPRLEESDPFYRQLVRQMGGELRARIAIDRSLESNRFLTELRAIGRGKGNQIDVLGCFEIPLLGMAIMDYPSANSMVRLNFHSSPLYSGDDAYVDIYRNTPEGLAAHIVLHEYYNELRARSQQVPDFLD